MAKCTFHCKVDRASWLVQTLLFFVFAYSLSAATDSLSPLLHRPDILVALVAAFGFGAAHAMSPGHGKTIVAAYLVGSRGTLKHALFLGAMVTLTHTLSVFALGLGTLFLSRYVVPDKIFPILATVSGLMIVIVGGSLFLQRLENFVAHSRAHAKGAHHDHGPGGHSHTPEGEVTFSSLTGLAISGGLVPCPSALVLLLSAIAIGRIGLGLLLLTSFSFGLSLVLIGIGCIVLYAKNLLPDKPAVTHSTAFQMLPVASAALITIVGLFMTAVALGYVKTPWVQV